MARDSFSFLHLPMVAGIVLVALGMKKALGHVEDPLKLVPTFALLGGTALYLLAHVAFRLRNVRTLNRRRLGLALALLALVPALDAVAAIVPLAFLAIALSLLIAYETTIYGEARQRVRHPQAASDA
jgi:low temperature requirement protein LtrA